MIQLSKAEPTRGTLHPHISRAIAAQHCEQTPLPNQQHRGSATTRKGIQVAWADVPPGKIKGHAAVVKACLKSKHLEEIPPVPPKPENLLPREGDEANSQMQQMFIPQPLILQSSENACDQVILEPFIRQSDNPFAAQESKEM